MNETTATSSWMRGAFLDVQQRMEHDLRSASRAIQHASTQGTVTERHWINLLRSYLPRRYEVSSGIIVDSRGDRSDQIDVVIFDQHFTPTLLDQESHRYIPVEAVYAVFEARPEVDKANLTYAGEKAASVRGLHRTSVRIPHAGGEFAPKPLFPIVGGIVSLRATWADGLGDLFRAHLPTGDLDRIDCGCAVETGAFDAFDDHMSVYPKDGGLVRFLFRLLWKLQSLGSVPAIDWVAYGDTLNT